MVNTTNGNKQTRFSRAMLESLRSRLAEAVQHDVADSTASQIARACVRCGAAYVANTSTPWFGPQPTCKCLRCPDRPALESQIEMMKGWEARLKERKAARRSYEQWQREVLGPEADHAWFRTYDPVTDSQRRALEAVKGYTGQVWSLLLAGQPGRGKTHLLIAHLKHNVRASKQHLPVPSTFATESSIREAWLAANDNVFRPKGLRDYDMPTASGVIEAYQDAAFLYLDELGVVKPTAAWASAMEQILCERHRLGRPTVISTNMTAPILAERYGTRIASRLRAGVIVEVDGPDGRQPR